MKRLKSTIYNFYALQGAFGWLLLATVFMFSFKSVSFAQPPQSFSYQAVVRDNAGEFLANQLVNLRLSIRSATATGTILYQETHLATTNLGGQVNLMVGLGTPTSGTFSAIVWSSGLKFIQIEIDKTGGTNFISLGATQLVSVPFALYAPPDADWNISGTTMNSGVTGNVGIGTTSPTSKLHVLTSDNSNAALYVRNNGSFRGIRVFTQGSCALWVENSGNHGLRVTQCMGNGVNITAAHGNGIHVEQADGWAGYFNGTGYFSGNVGIGNLTPAAKLHVSGNIIANDPTAPTHVATKQYVDLLLVKYDKKFKELENSIQKLIEINQKLKQRIEELEK
jgi:hypothetical protein